MDNFEFFRKDVVITGQHAVMCDDMWSQNDIKHSFFKRLVDLYTIAPVIGLRMHHRSAADTYLDHKRTVQLGQIMTRRDDLMTIMQMVLLLDQSRNLSAEERVDRTFRGPKDQEEFDADVDLFNSYVRGGIEILHKELIARALGVEDKYTNRKVGNIMALLNNPLAG